MSRRTLDDLPPIASDDELMLWSQQLGAGPSRPSRPNRPLVAKRITSAMSTQELFSEIEERAAAVYARRQVIARRSALAGRTSTS